MGDATPIHGLESGYALAYEEAKRALDAQLTLVGELRSRSGVLVAAAAITTSLFRSYDRNERQLSIQTTALRLGALLIVGEVAAWIADLLVGA